MDGDRQVTLSTVHGLTTVMTYDTSVVASFVEDDAYFLAIGEIFTDSSDRQIAHYLIVMPHIYDRDGSIVLFVLLVVHLFKSNDNWLVISTFLGHKPYYIFESSSSKERSKF
jgi:hypothetical protein